MKDLRRQFDEKQAAKFKVESSLKEKQPQQQENQRPTHAITSKTTED